MGSFIEVTMRRIWVKIILMWYFWSTSDATKAIIYKYNGIVDYAYGNLVKGSKTLMGLNNIFFHIAEPFRTLKADSQYLQKFVDVFALPTEVQKILPKAGKTYSCFHERSTLYK